MALTANLVRTAVTADGTETTWTDQTVYGSPNPNRNQVALYLTAYKMDSNQESSVLIVDSFDPEVVTSFVTDNDVDGWYQYRFVIVNNWLIGTTYNRYDVVWSPTENAFYQYINVTPSAGNLVTDPVYFIEIDDPTGLIDDLGTEQAPGNLVYQVINKILSYETAICYLKLSSKYAKENCASGDCGCDSPAYKTLIKIRTLFYNLTFDEVQGKFIQGEKNARLAEKYCSDCGCIKR